MESLPYSGFLICSMYCLGPHEPCYENMGLQICVKNLICIARKWKYYTTCYVFKDFIGIKRKIKYTFKDVWKKQTQSRRSFTIIIAVVNIRVKDLILYWSQGRLHMTGTKQSFLEKQSFRHQVDWFLILYIYTGISNLFPIKLTWKKTLYVAL
jgi:hypothetical protein